MPIRSPYPLRVLDMAASQWLLENGIPCTVCKLAATHYKRRDLEPGQTLLNSICKFCGDLGDIVLNEIFEPFKQPDREDFRHKQPIRLEVE